MMAAFCLIAQQNYPFTTPSGRKRNTFFEMPASWLWKDKVGEGVPQE